MMGQLQREVWTSTHFPRVLKTRLLLQRKETATNLQTATNKKSFLATAEGRDDSGSASVQDHYSAVGPLFSTAGITGLSQQPAWF